MVEARTPIRVMVAEDDEGARALMMELLTGLGYEVVACVATGSDAVRSAAELKPDVVVLDVHMPDGSGIAAAEQISRENSGIAVVLYTGDEQLSLSDGELASTAALALLPKPAPARVIDTTLRMAVSRARELSAARQAAGEARTQLENRKVVERAKGILMRRTGLSEQEAYRVLQRSSQDRAVPMVVIARSVIESEPGFAGGQKP